MGTAAAFIRCMSEAAEAAGAGGGHGARPAAARPAAALLEALSLFVPFSILAHGSAFTSLLLICFSHCCRSDAHPRPCTHTAQRVSLGAAAVAPRCHVGVYRGCCRRKAHKSISQGGSVSNASVKAYSLHGNFVMNWEVVGSTSLAAGMGAVWLWQRYPHGAK